MKHSFSVDNRYPFDTDRWCHSSVGSRELQSRSSSTFDSKHHGARRCKIGCYIGNP